MEEGPREVVCSSESLQARRPNCGRRSTRISRMISTSVMVVIAVCMVMVMPAVHAGANEFFKSSVSGTANVDPSQSRFLNEDKVYGESKSIKALKQPFRTGFHFQPRKNWMNEHVGDDGWAGDEPATYFNMQTQMAQCFYKGYYHLFYQYNPYAAVWGNIVWGHVVSKDLLHWRYLKQALKGDQWYDIKGVWSGSATFLKDGSPVLLYTGWTNASAQVQNMAVPANKSDPLLRHWVKVPENPIAVAPSGYNSSEFRDPTTAWQGPDGVWKILVGANRGVGGSIGTALVYKSKDFRTWDLEHPLHSVAGTGMWECPDFYPVPVSGTLGLESSVHGPSVKHVLKISSDNKKHDYYSVGTYNVETDTYEPESPKLDTAIGLRYDYGKYYASKTFFDQHMKRRILLGWVNESDSVQDDIKKDWSSVQAIPRKVWLDSSTSTDLIQWPIEEVERLRTTKVSMEKVKLNSGSAVLLKHVHGVQLDLELVFDLPDVSQGSSPPEFIAEEGQLACSQTGAGTKGLYGPFGILVLATDDLQEQTAVYFHLVHSKKEGWKTLVCSDQSRSSVASELDKTTYGSYVRVHRQDNFLSLRVLVDHSVVETFAQGGRTVITSRVYPALAIGNSARVFLFNNGTQDIIAHSVTVWNMRTAKITSFA